MFDTFESSSLDEPVRLVRIDRNVEKCLRGSSLLGYIVGVRRVGSWRVTVGGLSLRFGSRAAALSWLRNMVLVAEHSLRLWKAV